MKLLIDVDQVAYIAALRGQGSSFYAIVNGEEPSKEFIDRTGVEFKDDISQWLPEDTEEEVWSIGKVVSKLNPLVYQTSIKKQLRSLASKPGISEVVLCYGKGKNFRFDVATINKYKGQRDPASKPLYLQEACQFMLGLAGDTTYPCPISAYEFEGVETDDIMGWLQRVGETCIFSQDKDLRTIPGMYMDCKTESYINLSDWDADLWLYQQILMGDSTDNVYGIKGIGKAKSLKLLKDCKNEMQMANLVYQTYEAAMMLPNEKRQPRSLKVKGLPSVREARVWDVVGEIAELVYIRRSMDGSYVPKIFSLCEQMSSGSYKYDGRKVGTGEVY
jgi:hypothetical protein